MLVLAVAVNESVLVSAVDAALVVVNVRAACAAVVVGDIAATRQPILSLIRVYVVFTRCRHSKLANFLWAAICQRAWV
jgi:hypothetical protein